MIDVLLGKTMLNVENKNDEEVIFTTTDGETYKLYHEQDCCEYVRLEDVIGDLKDLVGSPILMAETVSNERVSDEYGDGSTWTFYKLATINGYVTLRWCGSSNGYYSEGVDFSKLDKETGAWKNSYYWGV